MNYRLECLTPLLVGDGTALSPIDYMVWKDQVNVLDQRRIFKLLSKGPRLDGYLSQVKKAEKLDFASWGGFAQNFAGRRIPFEHASSSAYWQRLRAEDCHIPTFTRTQEGPYLPGSALRGALRTAIVAGRMDEKILLGLEQVSRRPGEAAEQRAFGGDRLMNSFAIGDSAIAANETLKVYLVRTSTMAEAKGGAPGEAKRYALGWKVAGRGSAEPKRIDDSSAEFVEMAGPGTSFEGAWSERSRSQRDSPSSRRILDAANEYAAITLEAHKRYAAWSGLAGLVSCVDGLIARLEQARASGSSCLVALGWGSGLLGKTAWPKTNDDSYRKLLGYSPFYARAVRSGMPFPKTRRVVFAGNQPAALAGWAELQLL